MNLDTIIHPVRNFAELKDEDVTAFLCGRESKSEGPYLEFKSEFPRGDKEFDIREICKHIVAFLNAEGGLVVYGVSDRVHYPDVPFPDYIPGLSLLPSPEDVSKWVKERIYPSVEVPQMRVFDVAGRKVAVLEISQPVRNKPYCYYDPISRGTWYFKRTGTGVSTLSPGEIREFYATALIEQAAKFLRSGELTMNADASQAAARRQRVEAHKEFIKSKLENIQDFGFVGIYALPAQPVTIPWNSLADFVTKHRLDFSEEMRHYPNIEPFQDRVSVGYFPRAIAAEVKSTWRATLYMDGMVAVDSQADEFMGKYDVKNLNPQWLSYQLQRHLQMGRALLEGIVDAVHLIVNLEQIENFHMRLEDSSFRGVIGSAYLGPHKPVEREVALTGIYLYDSEKRNIVMPDVIKVMEEICRIFGFSAPPPTLWDRNGYLTYVKGLENSR